MNVLWFGNVIDESGFGRIGNALCLLLQRRGHTVGACGLGAAHVPYGFPYQVWALAGHDWTAEFAQIAQGNPWDAVIVCQDWPYLQAAANHPRVDWSRKSLIGITPTDGAPILQEWMDCTKQFDALFTISHFGVETFLAQGGFDRWQQPVEALIPGVDRTLFRPPVPGEKDALREAAKLPKDAYVLGAFMAAQGRKNWPDALELFGRLRQHVPQAELLCDADTESPMGWKLPVLAKQIAQYRHLPDFSEHMHFRADLQQRGLVNLRDRMALCDVGVQLAYREGYGLPVAELQACGVLTMALDWCSGTELCGEGRGLLVPKEGRGRFGTWGNAIDHDPDLDEALRLLLKAHREPAWAAAIREKALAAVKEETWEKAADVLHDRLLDVQQRRQAAIQDYPASLRVVTPPSAPPVPTPVPVPPPLAPVAPMSVAPNPGPVAAANMAIGFHSASPISATPRAARKPPKKKVAARMFH